MGVHGSTIDDVPWDEGPPHTPVLIIAHVQWPFQDPRLEVPTMYKAYVREYPHKIWPYMVQYLHFRILEFPLMYLMLIGGDWNMAGL